MKKQKMVKVLEDPKVIELLKNPNLDRIITILRKGELNTKEIHKLFNKDYEEKKTLTSMYRYLDKLVEHDLIFVSKEELKRGHLLEKYYKRTAMFFMPKSGDPSECIEAAFELLQQIYEVDEEKGKDLKKLIKKRNESMEKLEIDFFETHGEKLLALEKKYGFDVVKCATYTSSGIEYLMQSPELSEKILNILKG